MIVYSKSNPHSIESLFDTIAPQYDKANAVMSFNLHKRWNSALTEAVLSCGEPRHYLDLCSGTGEIAFTLLKNCKSDCEAFLLDFSENMLSVAKKKAKGEGLSSHSLHYLRANAEEIPLPRESMDAITIAYGIRNVANPGFCFKEAYRVLKKGGVFAILELTQPKNVVMKACHRVYMNLFLPIIGKFVASNKQAYEYLCNSIKEFLSPLELESILKENCFTKTAIRPLNGGIATLITAIK